MDSIEELLIERLTEKFGTRPELSDGLAYIGVDSVGMAELTIEIEKDFDIHVDDSIVECDTVQELAAYIRTKKDAAAPE